MMLQEIIRHVKYTPTTATQQQVNKQIVALLLIIGYAQWFIAILEYDTQAIGKISEY